MKIFCSWCGKKIGEKEPLEDRRTSHGVCPVCAVGIRAEAFRLVEEAKREKEKRKQNAV